MDFNLLSRSKLNSQKLIFLSLFVCLTLGILGGTVIHLLTPASFQSVARFQAQLEIPEGKAVTSGPLFEASDLNHGSILDGSVMIEEAANQFKLFGLPSFQEFSKEGTVEYIEKSLTVVGVEPNVYEVKVSALAEKDSQVLLNSLLQSYKFVLESQARSRSQRLEEFWTERNARDAKENAESEMVVPKEIGYAPVTYSFEVLEAAKEGIKVNTLVTTLLVGAGVAAAVWLMIFLLFRMLGLYSLIPLATAFFGFFGGIAMYYTTQPVYESAAAFHVVPAFLPTGEVDKELTGSAAKFYASNHASRLTELSMVKTIVESEMLHDLDSFEMIERADVPEFALQNLDAEPDAIEPTKTRLKFRAINPKDARTVTANLVSGYAEQLENALPVSDERLEFSGLKPEILVTDDADFGKRIWPIYSTYLLYGALAGYIFGLALASVVRPKPESDGMLKGGAV